MEEPLAGKVAIVTGAGRYNGIGRHIALSLARRGADVVVTGAGRAPEDYPEEEKEMGWRDAESVAEEVRGLGRRAIAATLDVTNEPQVEALVASAREELGRLDILVNNAASRRGSDRVPLTQLDAALWRQVLEVSLTGTFLMSKAAAKAMIEGGEGGRIVNIGSIAGQVGMPAFGAYGTSKAGVMQLTRVLAAELAAHGINVNCVCPGLVDTHRMRDITHGPIREAALRTIPLGRAGEPEELGEVVAFLCGPSAAYIHGQTLNVDGGRVMR